jgi:hypothetical protein
LVVFPIEEFWRKIDEGLEEGEGFVTIAPDDLHKADTSGGDPYQVALPDLRADGELLNERIGVLCRLFEAVLPLRWISRLRGNRSWHSG